eukprot:scaffold2277_cov256-Pinguiococcus_pyrenoidosus.AAC.6
MAADALHAELQRWFLDVMEAPELPSNVSFQDTRYAFRSLLESEEQLLRGLGNAGLEHVCLGSRGAEGVEAAEEVLQHVRSCMFHGRCVLLLPSAASSVGRFSDCDFEDVILDLSAQMTRCDTVRLTMVGENAVVRNCLQIGPDTGEVMQFPRRLRVEPGPEVGSGRFGAELALHMSYEAALKLVMSREREADGAQGEEDRPQLQQEGNALGYIGAESDISNSTLRCCRLLGRAKVVNSHLDTVLCDVDTQVQSFSTVTRVFLQAGSRVGGRGATSVEDCFFCQKASASNGARVTNCLLGPEAHLEAMEATCSLIGPSIGMHHSALLIACLWPEGRGNLACGALVGSNHTGRAPDTMLWAGEGVFVGLGAQVKYPQTLLESPYSLVAAGVLLPAQRLMMPFSLVVASASDASSFPRVPRSDQSEGRPISATTPRVLPGWVLRYSMYTVVRNESKFRSRTKVLPPSGVVHGVLRDATVRLCMGARRCITQDLDTLRSRIQESGQVADDRALAHYAVTSEDMPSLGACWAQWRDCVKGIEDYSSLITLHALRCLLEYVEFANGLGDGDGPPVIGAGYFDAFQDTVCSHAMLPGPRPDDRYPSAWRVWLLSQELGFDVLSPQAGWRDQAIKQLKALPDREERVFESALRSKMRDATKASPITPLYDEAATPLDGDNLDSALASAARRVEEVLKRTDAAVKCLEQAR